MMYLVLTALLALNVSQETLDVIAKVDKSLNQTIDNFASQNNLTYASFEKAYTINPTKVGPFKEKAYIVRENAQAMIDLINQYKWKIVSEADGKKAQLDSIRRVEDMNVPAQVMLVEKPIDYNNKRISRAEDLRNKIIEYRSFLLGMVNPNDSVLVHSIQNGLQIVDPPATARESGRTWEQDNFEYLPLIGVITLMSKVQSDIRNAESDVLNYLYSGIDEESFKFNDLVAAVIPVTSNTVVAGNPYEAEVFLAAIDTTQDPQVLVNNRAIPIRNSKGIYSATPTNPGNYKWGGIINYTGPDGRTISYPFESEYNVIPPILIVSPTRMNVFYRGVANPVEINVPGATPGSIQVTMTNADFTKVGDFAYEVLPRQDYGEAIIKVSADFGGARKQMPDKRFRLRKVPDPIAMVAEKKSGNIAKNLLLAQSGVAAVMENFEFDMQFIVQSFVVMIVEGQFVKDEPSTSAYFTDKQKSLMNSLRRGDRLFIEQIIARGPDNIDRPLSPLIFTIQ